MNRRYWLLLLLIIGGYSSTSAQRDPQIIHHDWAVFASQNDLGIGRVHIYVEILFDDLQFVKSDSGYRAEYEISAVVHQGKYQVDGKSWTRRVSVADYDRTNSRGEVDLSDAYFDLDPGDYKLTLTFADLSADKTVSVDSKLRVEDFLRSGFAAGGITFARRVDLENGQIRQIVPLVTNPFKGLGSPSFAYFEVYTVDGSRQAEVTYKIVGENSKTTLQKKFLLPLSGERTGMALKLPVDSLQYDSYRLELTVSNNRKTAVLKKRFYIRWPGLPRSAKDLDTAVQQLQFIATQTEWKKLKKASAQAKREAFIQFWSRRDPSPGTEYNEVMEAYYQRVNVANELFSVMGREGWRSDRGLVYIILGPPDEQINQPYPSDSKPYQIWQYYSINRQFAFYDRSGYGDFELINPVSIYDIQRYLKY